VGDLSQNIATRYNANQPTLFDNRNPIDLVHAHQACNFHEQLIGGDRESRRRHDAFDPAIPARKVGNPVKRLLVVTSKCQPDHRPA
jgi:hypothetical protein